jgi:hypothetical protein
MSLGFLLFVLLLCITASVAIGRRKNIDTAECVALGLLLGVIGVLIVVCMKPRLPKAPVGMRAVKCPRCNTVQNIPYGDASYDCYQCHTVTSVQAPRGVARPAALPAATAGLSTYVQCYRCNHRQKVPVSARVFECSECHTGLQRKVKQT